MTRAREGAYPVDCPRPATIPFQRCRRRRGSCPKRPPRALVQKTWTPRNIIFPEQAFIYRARGRPPAAGAATSELPRNDASLRRLEPLRLPVKKKQHYLCRRKKNRDSILIYLTRFLFTSDLRERRRYRPPLTKY
ncbi:hypothetical protein EVAR_8149_1 [Eumeta japonica]|uniref:Uncharacterized protein n=1 Tax=Eumeta variegata TaxID=151549 RepID=A0A4C1TTD9_EUMVA|nr:hypothetical protein EVAR_8149_1 [Eumeta japonica]